MIQTKQAFAVRDESTGGALSLVLDTGQFPKTSLEIYVASSDGATFDILGSMDGVTYRKTGEMILTVAGEKHSGFANAYRYVKVETDAVNDNVIEIVAGG
jgi:hypothetical protein